MLSLTLCLTIICQTGHLHCVFMRYSLSLAFTKKGSWTKMGFSLHEKYWSSVHYSKRMGLTSPYSANRKQARGIINNSNCYLTQCSLHNMLLSQVLCYQGPFLVNHRQLTTILFSLCDACSLSYRFTIP